MKINESARKFFANRRSISVKGLKGPGPGLEDTFKIIAADLIKLLNENGINAKIAGREKTPFSIWRKIQNKKISLEQLTDIIGF